jgi:hypothetical protein
MLTARYLRASVYGGVRQEMDGSEIEAFVSDKVTAVLDAYPEEWSRPPAGMDEATFTQGVKSQGPGTQGLLGWCEINSSNPTKAQDRYTIYIKIHPIQNLWLRNTQYVKDGHTIAFLSNAQTPEAANAQLGLIKELLKKNHFAVNGKRPKVPSPNTRSIPHEWLNVVTMGLVFSSPSYLLKLCSNHDRMQQIAISMRTGDADEAQRRATLLTDSFIKPMMAADEIITLERLNQFLDAQHFPQEPKSLKRYSPSSKISIAPHAQEKCWIATPAVNAQYDVQGHVSDYNSAISIVPTQQNRSFRSSINRNLNSADIDLARQRTHQMQMLVAATLHHYFTKYPTHYFVLSGEEILAKGKGRKFALPPLNGMRDSADGIYFEDIRKSVIAPALEQFGRYIRFDAVVAQDATNNEYPFALTFQPKRNVGQTDESLSETESHQFRAPQSLQFADEEKAKAFGRELNRLLTAKLYERTVDPQTQGEVKTFNPDGMMSVERPVMLFGAQTTDMVLRETIRNVLQQEQFKGSYLPPERTSPLGALIGGRSMTN